MTRSRFTVVHGQRFESRLAMLWLGDRHVQKVIDELEPVLRTIPDQAGELFYFEGAEYWHLAHQSYELICQILANDCQVRLIDVRPIPTRGIPESL
jgi:hypothetical protein